MRMIHWFYLEENHNKTWNSCLHCWQHCSAILTQSRPCCQWEKTKQIILGRHKDTNRRLPQLEECNFSKYLDVIIDDSLTWWTYNIDTLCQKLSSDLYKIRSMKHNIWYCQRQPKLHIMPYVYEFHLQYEIVVWRGTTLGNLQRVGLYTPKESHLSSCKLTDQRLVQSSFLRV